MIHFKLTKNNVKRLVTTMLLIAPIVYLFGSVFTALNGSHDGFPFSASYEVVTDSDYVDFNQQIVNQNSAYSANGITMTPLSDGSGWVINGVATADFNFTATRVVNYPRNHVCLFGARNLTTSITGFYIRDQWSYLTSDGTYLRRSALVDGNLSLAFVVASGTSFSNVRVLPMFVDLTKMYGAGNEPTYDGFAASFPDPFYSYTLSTPSYITYETVPDSAQFLFNQFFPKDNFLVQIGENALGTSPVGFAPFGALFRFIDLNMLHFADSQVGLMAYGYMYWCAHVLLFVVLFDLTTFFITWISHIGDKFGGNADE